MQSITTKEALEAWLRTYSAHSTAQLNNEIRRYTGLATILASAKDSWWIKREIARTMYEFGQVYHPLPDAIVDSLTSYGADVNQYHFPHLSMLDPTKIAFTPTWEDGVADRQQQISLGKYIKKFHPHIPEYLVKEMQEYLNNLLVDIKVEFTTDFNKIYNIYHQCAPACMSKGSTSYSTHPRHPLEAYIGAPGLSLAYIEKDNQFISRCFTYANPEQETDKRYVRVYGDSVIAAQLDKMGYRRASLEGVRIPRIQLTVNKKAVYLVPYIDDHSQGAQGTGTVQAVKEDPEDDTKLIICNNQASGALGSTAAGYVVVPVWKPRLLEEFSREDEPLRADAEGAHPEWFMLDAPKTVRGAMFWDRDDDIWRHGFFDFKTLENIQQHTALLHGGGRLLINDYTTERGIVAVWDGVNVPNTFWPFRKAHDGLRQVRSSAIRETPVLTMVGQPEYRFVMAAVVLMHKDLVIENRLMGGYIPRALAVKLTHGHYAGTHTSRDNTACDWLNPDHIYYSGEVTHLEIDGVYRAVPHAYVKEHTNSTAAELYGPMYDSRVSAYSPTGVLLGGKGYYIAGTRFRSVLNHGPRVFYDHLIFARIDEDSAIYVEQDVHAHQVALSKHLVLTTLEANNNQPILAYSPTPRTIEQAQALLNLATSTDFGAWVRSHVASSPMFGVQSHVDDDAWDRIADEVMRSAKQQIAEQTTSPATEPLVPQLESTVDSPATQNDVLDDLPF